MKRRDEFLVGLAVLGGLVAVIVGALFLSDADVGRQQTRVARFRSVGRLQPGAPVVFRGVKVGRVDALRLADNDWVEADLRVARTLSLPSNPAVIAVPASLFGDWQAVVLDRTEVTDPNVRAALDEAAEGAGEALPGADLPDIGELTAQASRIAADVGSITERVEGAIDSAVIADLRLTVTELRRMASRLNEFSQTEASALGRITGNTERLTSSANEASQHLTTTLGRVEEATRDGRLERMAGAAERTTANIDSISEDLRMISRTARESRETMVRVLTILDTTLTRLEAGRGSLGMLVSDSTLYRETTRAVSELRALIVDIRENPRKYFRFSVF